MKSVFKRLSISNDDLRPRLSSRVIKELPTRQEVLKAQGSDLESRARNRRMFGSLLGTLHKFCQEESRLKLKEDKKAQVEKKLEQQQLLEREALRKERDFLLINRQKKHAKITTLELKLNRLKDFTAFEKTLNSFKYCIKTKTKPSIYYRPYKYSKKTQLLLSDSRETLLTEMTNRKIMLNNELKEFDFENDTDNKIVKGTAFSQKTLNLNKPCAIQGKLSIVIPLPRMYVFLIKLFGIIPTAVWKWLKRHLVVAYFKLTSFCRRNGVQRKRVQEFERTNFN